MHKGLGMPVACVLAGVLAACGGNTDKEKTTSTQAGANASATPSKKASTAIAAMGQDYDAIPPVGLVVVASLEGEDIKQIKDAEYPAWSPDGSRLAFSSGIDHESTIYVSDAAGKNRKELGPGWAPTWSPDGKRIAYQLLGRIYVMDSDGSDIKQIASSPTGYVLKWPQWSPAGDKVAVVGDGEEGGSGLDTTPIYMLNPDGKKGRLVQLKVTGSLKPIFNPVTWSPDAKQLAFTSAAARSAVGIMNADGSNAHKLPGTGSGDLTPSWEPNGKHLCFSRQGEDDPNQNTVYTITPTGKDKKSLFAGPGAIACVWRP